MAEGASRVSLAPQPKVSKAECVRPQPEACLNCSVQQEEVWLVGSDLSLKTSREEECDQPSLPLATARLRA